MSRFAISYSVWKDIVQQNNFVVYFVADEGTTEMGTAFAGTDEYIYITRIVDDTWTDFDTTFATRTACARRDDAIAQIVGLKPPVTPRTSDGKRISLNAKYRGDFQQWFPGAGDDTGKGDDTLFGISQSAIGDSAPFDFNWNDALYLGGGYARIKDAVLGDWISFCFCSPATAVVANAGLGDVNLTDIGGGNNIIIPAPGTDGSHDVTISSASPVPVVDMDNPDGYWHYTNPDEGTGTFTPVSNPAAPDGQWNLYDFQIILINYVPRCPLLGSGLYVFNVDVKPKRILPQWKGRVVLHNVDGTHTVEACWYFETSRKDTT